MSCFKAVKRRSDYVALWDVPPTFAISKAQKYQLQIRNTELLALLDEYLKTDVEERINEFQEKFK